MQDPQSLVSTDIPLVLGQVEAQDCGGETGYQRGGGSETGFVGVSQADVEVKETAGVALGSGIGVVGLVGKDADGGRGDALVGLEGPDVGEGVGKGGFDEGVFGGGDGLLMAAVILG